MKNNSVNNDLIPVVSDTDNSSYILKWPELKSGILLKRYKRFLADILLDDGTQITAHCPNSGSMKTCSEPGLKVWISESLNRNRKLPFTWELIRMPSSIVGVNAILPNRLVKSAISMEIIPEISGFNEIIPEFKTSDHTRLDFCARSIDRTDCFIEVKNCTYVENGLASFPDAVSLRARKHVEELAKLAKSGYRSIIFFIVQRMDADCFSPADCIDTEYGKALRKAASDGVEILVYDTLIDDKGIGIRKRLPVLL